VQALQRSLDNLPHWLLSTKDNQSRDNLFSEIVGTGKTLNWGGVPKLVEI